MFGFFKKKEEVKPEPRKVYVPTEHIPRVLGALDNLEKVGKADNLAHYEFWMLAQDICPEITDGNWRFKPKAGVKPYFLELLD